MKAYASGLVSEEGSATHVMGGNNIVVCYAPYCAQVSWILYLDVNLIIDLLGRRHM